MRNLLLILSGIIVLTQTSFADNLSIDVRSGYGILKFEEKENYHGDDFDSEFKHNVILLGVSGEYTLPENKHFYAEINIDWAFGLKDRETLRQNGEEVQKNEMRVSLQFYGLRLGYKDIKDNFYYRFYIRGGWDGLRFKRENYVWRGVPIEKSSIEEISLWVIGAGMRLGVNKDRWSLDGKLSYFYYPNGETEDSSIPHVTFDTNGSRLNIDIGLTREIMNNLNLYFGGNYILQRLKGNTVSEDISWKAKLQILAGVINLRYIF